MDAPPWKIPSIAGLFSVRSYGETVSSGKGPENASNFLQVYVCERTSRAAIVSVQR